MLETRSLDLQRGIKQLQFLFDEEDDREEVEFGCTLARGDLRAESVVPSLSSSENGRDRKGREWGWDLE